MFSQIDTSLSQTWHIQPVDAPKVFHNMGDRSPRLDKFSRPHIAYGQDHLCDAWHDGSTWHPETADNAWGMDMFVSLTLDEAGNPYISYYDNSNSDLK